MKKYIVISLMLILCGVAQAQEKGNYFYINAGGGMHNIDYKLANGTVKNSLGFTGNLGWNYFFNSHLGFGIGLGVQTFKSVATLNYMTSNAAVDADGDAYNYRIYYTDWQETQNMGSLDIPIGFSYQTKFNDKSGMMFSLGAKISIPVKTSFKSTAGEIDTKGYYQQWNVELSDMPQHDFYTLNSIAASKFTANTSYAIYFDAGYLHNLSKNMDLYLGIYGNYGLNNLIKPTSNFVYQQGGTYNGVLSSDQVDKANLFSAGIKIGINLHIPSKAKTVIVNPEIVAKTEPVVVKVEEPVVDEVVVEKPVIEEVVPAIVVETPKEPEISNVILEKGLPIDEANKIIHEIKINYTFDSKAPIEVQVDKLKELAQLLKHNPKMKILVVGHTSNEGSKKANIKIGLKRAQKVKNLLMKYGAPAKQITTQTKYYLQPIAPNTNIENRMKNRRVELFVK